MTLAEWLEAYRRAWEERDPERVLPLFTEDAVYRSHPFREPHRGHDGIRAYWEWAVGDQRDVRVRFGEPLVEGKRVAVEWWTTHAGGTIAGVLVLRFAPDGRCEELREAWAVSDERREPPY